jgi:RNA polymerase-binding transcription factor DksA
MVDLSEARRRLELQRERIRERIASETEILPAGRLPTESHYATPAADLASETFEEEKALGLRAHFEGELHAVEDALRRIDEGTYGKCAECGTEIPPERLEAVPAASHCVVCQRRAEARR